jgi:hypothetical protein
MAVPLDLIESRRKRRANVEEYAQHVSINTTGIEEYTLIIPCIS